MDDLFYMKHVVRLAKKGLRSVSPNPLVGSLIVKNEQILSEGYHAYFGGPHAEVDALSKLSMQERRDATLYVNLEPCCHYGKTPPCTEMILQSKLRKIVIGTADPNPLVKGRGIEILKKSGIEVVTDVLNDRCERLNAPYFKYMQEKKPYITMKIAQTVDGKIATDQYHSRWITNESSRRAVHRLRRESDAILVCAGTVIHDNPDLTLRMVRGKNPKRIILDRSLDMPLESRVLQHPDTQNTIVVTTKEADPEVMSIKNKAKLMTSIINGIDNLLIANKRLSISVYMKREPTIAKRFPI